MLKFTIALTLAATSFWCTAAHAEVRESAGLEHLGSQADREMGDDMDGIFIDNCDLSFVDFGRNNIKGLSIDPVVSPVARSDSEIMGGIIKNLSPTDGKKLSGKPFSVISCKRNRSAGANGKVIMGSDNTLQLLMLESGIRYPKPSGNQKGSYRVEASLAAIYVENAGFGYSAGDQIIIEPSEGASAVPVVENGKITSVKVVNPGSGFLSLPKVFVKGAGYNATLKPLLRFRSANNLPKDKTILVDKAPIDPKVKCTGIYCYSR